MILSLLFYAPFAAIALAGDVGENRLFNAVLQEAFGSFGLINSFAALFANTFVLAQTFFFIRLSSSDFGQSRMVSFLLLVSSLSYIIYTLAFVGRDGVILWSMTFVFQYLFFQKFMTKAKRKKIKRLGFLLITLAAVPFMVISVSRFGSTDKGTMWYLLNYFYQQTVNFNDQFQVEVPLQYGNFNFSVFHAFFEWLGLTPSHEIRIKDLFKYFNDKGVMPNAFSFWFGNILLDFGRLGSLLFFAAFAAVTRRSLSSLRRTGVFRFSDYVLFVLTYQIMYYGIFYFRYYSVNYYLLFCLLLIVLLKLSSRNTYNRSISSFS